MKKLLTIVLICSSGFAVAGSAPFFTSGKNKPETTYQTPDSTKYQTPDFPDAQQYLDSQKDQSYSEPKSNPNRNSNNGATTPWGGEIAPQQNNLSGSQPRPRPNQMPERVKFY